MKKIYFRVTGKTFAVILGLMGSTVLYAQKGETVVGVVTQTNQRLADVLVMEEGTQNHTFTNEKGEYRITLEHEDAVLLFEYFDVPQREVVNNRKTINIHFISDDIALQEVVVNAGYYTVKDKERTGSIARVTAKEIENQPVNNVLDALQGRVAGLEITPTTGTAGGGYNIQLRGRNSIAAGTEPLFIIDGVPYDTGSMSSISVSSQVLPLGKVNPLNGLDPQAIESIEILKDADATAIYGSRGANGVILITTKKGSEGKTSFHVESSTSVIEITQKMKLMKTDDYLQLRRDAFVNDGISNYPSNAFDVNGRWDPNRSTDWQKLFIGNKGMNHTLNSSIRGGNLQTSFQLGTTIVEESSVFVGDFKYKKHGVNFNLNHSSKDKRLELNLSSNYGVDRNKLPTQDLTKRARTLAPNAPELYNEDGSLNWEGNSWVNPIASLNSYYRSKSDQLNTNLRLKYRLTDFLDFTTNLGYNRASLEDKQYNPNTTRNPANGSTSAVSNMIKNNTDRESWIVEPQLSSEFAIGKKGKVLALVGATFNSAKNANTTMQGEGFLTNDLIDNLSAANTVVFLNDQESQYKYQAVFTRINYSYQTKYFINLTGRRDGSSRFSPENRFANFGAVGLAWIFSKEAFLEAVDWLSFGKIRGSYGVTGNDQIGDYQYLETYSVSQDGNVHPYLTPTRLYNPNFSWEKNKKLDIGLELVFFKNRLNLQIDYYRNRSDNQLIGYTLPATTGFSSIQANLNALVQNQGIELSLTTLNVSKTKFSWKTLLNLTIPQNKLLDFEDLATSNYANQFVIGKSIDIRKLYHYQGINEHTGIYEFYDYNLDGRLTAVEDKQVVVDFNPKWYGNMINTIMYGNFEMDFNLQFVKKKGYHLQQTFTMPGTMSNQLTDVHDYWSLSNVSSSNQLPSNGGLNTAYNAYQNYIASDAIVVDRSFLRLKTLAIGYTIRDQRLQGNHIQIFAQGYNLLTFSKYKVADPEHNQDFLPPLRRYTMGVKFNF